jgi:hypothetical protein
MTTWFVSMQVGITLEGLKPEVVELDKDETAAAAASSPAEMVGSQESGPFSPQPSPSARTTGEKLASVKRKFNLKLASEKVTIIITEMAVECVLPYNLFSLKL